MEIKLNNDRDEEIENITERKFNKYLPFFLPEACDETNSRK